MTATMDARASAVLSAPVTGPDIPADIVADNAPDKRVKAGFRVPRWPLFVIAAPAAVAVWSGWVGLGGLCGFGLIHPLPGIVPSLQLDTAITLPIGVEAYGAYALRAWLTLPRRRGEDGSAVAAARKFARTSAISALALGMLGQAAYHLLAAAHVARAPWPITALVACLPVVSLALGAGLAHLLGAAAAEIGEAGQGGEPDQPGRATVPPADPARELAAAKAARLALESDRLGAGTVPPARPAVPAMADAWAGSAAAVLDAIGDDLTAASTPRRPSGQAEAASPAAAPSAPSSAGSGAPGVFGLAWPSSASADTAEAEDAPAGPGHDAGPARIDPVARASAGRARATVPAVPVSPEAGQRATVPPGPVSQWPQGIDAARAAYRADPETSARTLAARHGISRRQAGNIVSGETAGPTGRQLRSVPDLGDDDGAEASR